MSAGSGDRAYWLGFGVLTLLALGPMWTVHLLPSADLPQHAAQVALIRDVYSGAPWAGQFAIDWWTPYVLGHALAYALSWLVTPWVAVKLVLTLAVVGLPLAMRSLLRRSGGLQDWSYLGFALAFGFSWTWGFLNFALAIPVGLWWLAAVWDHVQAPDRRTGVAVAGWAVATSLAHGLVFALLWGVAVLWLTVQPGTSIQRVRRLLPLLLPLLVVAPWLARTAGHGLSAKPDAWTWTLGRVTELPDLLVGFPVIVEPERRAWDLGLRPESLVGLLVMLVPLLARPRWQVVQRRWVPLLVVGVAYLTAPQETADVFLLWPRLAVFLLPLALLLLQPTRASWLARLAPAVLTATWLLWLTVRAQAFEQEARGVDAVLTQAQPGKKLLALVVAQHSEVVAGLPYLGQGALYGAEHGGWHDFSFASMPHFVAHYRPEHVPAADGNLAWDPRRFDVRVHGDYDYFLVRSRKDRGPQYFAQTDRPVRLLANAGWWWLYERAASQRP